MAKQKSNKSLMVVLAIAFIAFVVVAVFAPKPVDWSLSFSKRHDRPLGNKLVYSVLPDLYPGQNLVTMHSKLNAFLEGTIPLNTNFIFITNRFNPDSVETSEILKIIEAGNNVFVAAEHFSPEFIKPIHLKQVVMPVMDFSLPIDSINFNYSNRQLKTAFGYWFKKGISNNYIAAYDSTRTTVLGYNQDGKTNFIRIKIGEGYLYLNSNPTAFTNYQLLSGNNSEYIFKCLSYLPVTSTVWDEYHKPGGMLVGSELAYILNDRALRMAWYILLFGVLVYFIFKGKRRQRVIPVVEPPKNTSLEFIETVGRLYFVKHDHRGIARKRFIFFLDYLRTRYFVDTSVRDSKLIEDVSKKSGIAERTVAALFKVAGNLEKVNYISQEDLQQFNRQIEYFYKNCR